MLYIGSDKPITEIEWYDKQPSLYLSSKDGNIKDVIRNFSKKNVYYVGSHEGCGCGFFYDESDDDIDERKRSVQNLISIINLALENEINIELYVTWVGSEKKPPNKKLTLTPDQLLGKDFPLDEGDFVVFSKS